MFETMESFLLVTIPLAVILILMVLFEKQLLALEDRFDVWFAPKKVKIKKSLRRIFKVLKQDVRSLKKASKKASTTFVKELKKS